MSRKKGTSLIKNKPANAIAEPIENQPDIETSKYKRSMVVGQKIVKYPSVLPDPCDLEKYENLRPGAFDILLSMMQEEQTRVNNRKDKGLDTDIFIKKLLGLSVIVISLFGLIISIILALAGQYRYCAWTAVPSVGLFAGVIGLLRPYREQ